MINRKLLFVNLFFHISYLYIYIIFTYYNLFMQIREIKIRTNFGNMNLVNVYINTVNITKANIT